MSRYCNPRFYGLKPYTPGEQPQNFAEYIKLNTNELPLAPSPEVLAAAQAELSKANLYPDPSAGALRRAIAQAHGVQPEQVLVGNGSDEILSLLFQGLVNWQYGVCYADVTYGFYETLADLYHLPRMVIPVREELRIRPQDYYDCGRTAVIANPNSPTGLVLPLEQVRQIARKNPANAVILDEAYADFWGQSAISLLPECENLVVVRTFSKSYAMAGARLGYAIASAEIIADLEALRMAQAPYNVNRFTQAMGCAAISQGAAFARTMEQVRAVRAKAAEALCALGYTVLPSQANFLFAAHPHLSGAQLYAMLKQRGVLVRAYDAPRVQRFVRITIGTQQQMQRLIEILGQLAKEEIA